MQGYSQEEWKVFLDRYRTVVSDSYQMKDEVTGKEYPWDTFDMSIKIKNNMKLTNEDINFSVVPASPTKYIAAQLKFVKDEYVLELLKRFYLYEECNYNAEIYGTKIIDYCNEYCVSYTMAIFELACENNDFKEGCYFSMPYYHLYNRGSKMRWARLDENGKLYYIEPTYTPYTEEDFNEVLELYKKLRGNKKDGQ